MKIKNKKYIRAPNLYKYDSAYMETAIRNLDKLDIDQLLEHIHLKEYSIGFFWNKNGPPFVLVSVITPHGTIEEYKPMGEYILKWIEELKKLEKEK